MFNKKYMALFLFLIIGILAISHASAADLNASDEITSDVVDDNIIDEAFTKEVSNVAASDKMAKENDEEIYGLDDNENIVSGTNYGTFNDLESLFADLHQSV